VSRASKRTRARLVVTARFAADAAARACRTRDVSETGLLLESPHLATPGTEVHLSLLDEEHGDVIELDGVITRAIPQSQTLAGAVGIRLRTPPPAWKVLVSRIGVKARELTPTGQTRLRRLRVLVVADEANRRGALALYVQSGWDVRFASDLEGTEEALRGFHIDAVIAEHDLDDHRWPEVLEAARRAQPDARRIIRASLGSRRTPPAGKREDLVHRVVDLHAGLEAVLDALTAEWG
jgi:PilZ domain-containing protein